MCGVGVGVGVGEGEGQRTGERELRRGAYMYFIFVRDIRGVSDVIVARRTR